MLLGVNSARARDTSWRWPWLRFDPIVVLVKLLQGMVRTQTLTSFLYSSIQLALHARNVVLQSCVLCKKSSQSTAMRFRYAAIGAQRTEHTPQFGVVMHMSRVQVVAYSPFKHRRILWNNGKSPT
jgi:hypothetical protein